MLSIIEPGRALARAQDAVEDDVEEDDAQVEAGDVEGTEEESTEEESKAQGSPDIDVTMLFTKPEGNGMELPAGKPVEFLVGVTNNGNREFIIDAAEASFRYPMDFNFYIQNFSMAQYNKVVKPQQEATVAYSFFPADVFAGRPLGLQVNLLYHDSDGEDFSEAVFNSTISIVEVDEGLDGETFFLYVFLLAFAVLLLLVGHTLLSSFSASGGKKSSSKKQSSHQSGVEMGTDSSNGVDYEWLPEHLKAELKRQSKMTSNGSAPKVNRSEQVREDPEPEPPKKKPVSSTVRAPPTRSSPRLRKI
ncbi:Translocon-associated protein (TRAP) alpha subunit [Trinorchestia longiramus]|nr:Translocon-associated protein (TRAP) alpha subunit [Trinorchestia longiramus]